MQKWIKSLFTDGEWDADLVLVLIGLVSVFMCVKAWYTSSWDANSFGQGVGYVLGGGGLGYAARRFGDRKNGTSTDSSSS